MTSQDFVKYALQMTVMLGCAVFFGQLMRRVKQPAVLGEMIGGIVLGPTIFGLLAPSVYAWLFQSAANVGVVRDASIKLGMLFFLFIAGLETNLSDLRQLGRKAALIGLVGTLGPIAVGVALCYAMPRDFWGPTVQPYFFSFALFVGMNLANSANPVIARILMDLGLLHGRIGTMIMTATIVDDLINWTLFAIILRDIMPAGQATASLPRSIALVAAVFVLIVGLGRWLGPRALHWAKAHVTWPSGFIALIALLILVASSLSESLGIHAFLGAFLIGAALSGRSADHQEAHAVQVDDELQGASIPGEKGPNFIAATGGQWRTAWWVTHVALTTRGMQGSAASKIVRECHTPLNVGCISVTQPLRKSSSPRESLLVVVGLQACDILGWS